MAQPKIRVALYARQSLTRDERSASIDTQLEDLRALADRHGWRLVGEYVDRDAPADALERREAWLDLLEAAEAGGLDVVAAGAGAHRIAPEMGDEADRGDRDRRGRPQRDRGERQHADASRHRPRVHQRIVEDDAPDPRQDPHGERNQRHLDNRFPITILLFASALFFRRVIFSSFFAVFLYPGQGAVKFFGIINTLIHAAQEFGHIHRFHAHTKIGFEEVVIHDGSRNTHRDCAKGDVGFAPHGGNGYTGFALT